MSGDAPSHIHFSAHGFSAGFGLPQLACLGIAGPQLKADPLRPWSEENSG